MENTKEFYTVKELTKELGVTRTSIDRYVKKGLLKKYKVGNIAKGRTIFLREDVYKLLVPQEQKK